MAASKSGGGTDFYKQLLDDIKLGLGIKDQLMPEGGLGRVDDKLPTYGADPDITNMGELLARLRAESFIGGYNSPEQTAALENLRRIAETSGDRTADTADIIGRRKAIVEAGPAIDPTLFDVQRLLKDEYGRARDVSPDVQMALDRSKAGLGGLTSEQNQALLEQLTGDTNRAFQGATRNLAGSGFASGVGANPAMMQKLLQDYTQAQFGARNDILVRNADVQDRRLQAFSDLARMIDDTGYARAMDTLGEYGNFSSMLDNLRYTRGRDDLNLYEQSVAGAEADEFNRRMASGSQYANTLEANTQNNRADRMSRLQNYQNQLNAVLADNFNKVTTNINTNAAELSAATGITLGIPQYLESARSSSRANDIAEKQVNVLGGGGRRSGGGSSSGGGTAGPVANPDSFDTPSTGRGTI